MSASYEQDSQATLFLKYKEGKAMPNAPFKLFESQPTFTSTDEEYTPVQSKHRVRGPYRKYSCQEKEQAVECVLDFLCRSGTEKMSMLSLNASAFLDAIC
jgi:hypothetical protein